MQTAEAQKDAPKIEPVFDEDDFLPASLMTPRLRVWPAVVKGGL